jgi:hypothetical protein
MNQKIVKSEAKDGQGWARQDKTTQDNTRQDKKRKVMIYRNE